MTFLQGCPGCCTLWSHSQGKSKQRCLFGAGHLLSLGNQVVPEQGPVGITYPTASFSRGVGSEGGGIPLPPLVYHLLAQSLRQNSAGPTGFRAPALGTTTELEA